MDAKTDAAIKNDNASIKQLHVILPKGCKLLAETDKYVLAERTFQVNERNCTEYITWRKQYDGGVALGRYFANNLQAAKEDFARRPELVDEARLFSPDEMAVIYKALMEYDRSDTIDNNDKKLIQHIDSIRDKLKAVADVDKFAKVDVLIIEPRKPPYEARIYCEPYSFCEEVGGNTAVWCPFKDSAVVLANANGCKSGLPYNRTIDGEPYYGTIVIAGMNGRRCFVSLTEEQKKGYSQMFNDKEKDSFQKSVDQPVCDYEPTPSKGDPLER